MDENEGKRKAVGNKVDGGGEGKQAAPKKLLGTLAPLIQIVTM